MTLAYLVDTDWVIHWLNGHSAIGRRLSEAKDQGLALSVASLAELYEGVHYSTAPEENERQLLNFLRDVTVLGIDLETCQIFGKERGRLRAAGKLINRLTCPLAFRVGGACAAIHGDLDDMNNAKANMAVILLCLEKCGITAV